MLTAKLTSKGRLVIPKPIRDQLHLAKGVELAVTLENGQLILEPFRLERRHQITDWPGFGRPLHKLTTSELCSKI